MPALLDDVASVKHDDVVRVAHGAETVGDHDPSAREIARGARTVQIFPAIRRRDVRGTRSLLNLGFSPIHYVKGTVTYISIFVGMALAIFVVMLANGYARKNRPRR